MIKNFSDHAANERTYLAWVRTALAIAALGLAVVRLGLVARRIGAGTSISLVSVATLILLTATYRFVRLSHHLDRPETNEPMGVRSEILLSALLTLFIAIFGVLLWAALS